MTTKTTRPAPFLIDKQALSLLVVPSNEPIRLQLNVLRFCGDNTVVATNGHYLAAVKPDSPPDWRDFPAHGALDADEYDGPHEAFSLDAAGLAPVWKILRPCKKLPVLGYALVIPPIEGERTCRILVAVGGDPGNVVTFNVPVSEQRYPDFARIIADPDLYETGRIGNIRLDAEYLIEIMGIAKACDRDRGQIGVTLSFTDDNGQIMIHGHRFVAILMPMNTGTTTIQQAKDSAAEAKTLRTGFPSPKETRVAAKGSVSVGGISIPAIPGTTINGVRYGAPVVPLPEGSEVASIGR